MITHPSPSPTIRRIQAVPADTQALSFVEHHSLGDSAYTPAEMATVLAQPEHYAYLASCDEQDVGFVSCFETEEGQRLEVDMLGVLPAFRGRGIASRLIAHAVDEARARGVRSARGVVALDNTASQRAFAHAGFVPRAHAEHPDTPLVHAMLVYIIRGLCPQPLPAGWELELTTSGNTERFRLGNGDELVGQAECLCVQTLCYSGLWVEHLEAVSDQAQRRLARVLVERAKVLELDEVGYLAPQVEMRPPNPQAPRFLPFIRDGYSDRGDYMIYKAAWS